MKTRLLSLVLTLCMVLALFPVAVLADDTPIHITSAEQLAAVTGSGSYILDNDIDLSGIEFTAISGFSGKFDGNGHTITLGKIKGEKGTAAYYGLFGYLKGATVCNLNISGSITLAETDLNILCVGSIAGEAKSSIFVNCTSNAGICDDIANTADKTTEMGGFIGSTMWSSIANCAVYGDNGIKSNATHYDIGGFIGSDNFSTIVNCYCSNVNVSADNSDGCLAGFAGSIHQTTIKYCYAPEGCELIGVDFKFNEDDPTSTIGITALPDSQISGDDTDGTDDWANITIGDLTLGAVSLEAALNQFVNTNSGDLGNELNGVTPSNWNSNTVGIPVPSVKSVNTKPTLSAAALYATRRVDYDPFEIALTYTQGSELRSTENNGLSLDNGKIVVPAGLTEGTYTITIVAALAGVDSDPITFTFIVTPAPEGGNENEDGEKDECLHEHTEWREITPATYTRPGVEELYCLDCEQSLELTREIPVLERDFIFEISFLTFDTNGGNAIKSLTTIFGAKINLSEYVPVRDGYNFVGWFADKELTKPITNVQVIGITTVYAGWEEDALSFIDVDKDDTYYEDIKYVFDSGLMIGTSEVTFSPELNLNRAMVVTILWRMNGSPVVDYLMSFEDVPADEYYTEAVRWAASEGIVNGISSTEFAPKSNITREQLAAIIYRYVQKNGGGFTGAWYFPLRYDDIAEISEYADEAMHWCVMNGILEADENNELRPTENATRAETAHAYHILSTIEF